MASPELHHHPGLPGAAYRSEFAFGLMSFALPGFLATMLIAVGALGVGWLPLDTEIVDLGVVETMRTTTAGMWLSRLMVLVGVGLLLQTWLVMGSDLMVVGTGSQMRITEFSNNGRNAQVGGNTAADEAFQTVDLDFKADVNTYLDFEKAAGLRDEIQRLKAIDE